MCVVLYNAAQVAQGCVAICCALVLMIATSGGFKPCDLVTALSLFASH